MTSVGILKQEIQGRRKASRTVEALMLVRGTASNQRVLLSQQVSKYLNLSERERTYQVEMDSVETLCRHR